MKAVEKLVIHIHTKMPKHYGCAIVFTDFRSELQYYSHCSNYEKIKCFNLGEKN
jgi:hypothetical protein